MSTLFIPFVNNYLIRVINFRDIHSDFLQKKNNMLKVSINLLFSHFHKYIDKRLINKSNLDKYIKFGFFSNSILFIDRIYGKEYYKNH